MNKTKPSVYTTPLTGEQSTQLCELLEREGFEIESRPYMTCFGKRPGLTVAVYEKGPKAVIQGKGTSEFVTFTLEPQILGEAKFGYEEVHNPEHFEPHFGIDESGKGDFFGPLVIAGTYIDGTLARQFLDLGITDSKRISSDKKIRDFAAAIRQSRTPQTVICIGPERYNVLIEKMGNVNRVLAWGHARAIENLCEVRPDCPRALSDQFANPRVLEKALMASGRTIRLEQRTKAESDYAVAAASILARERFIDWLEDASRKVGRTLPRGASAAVKDAARDVIAKHGKKHLASLVKMHFKTAAEVGGV